MAGRFDTIRTDRLLMRRWREADRDPYAAMNADPVVMRYFPAVLDRAASDASIDKMEALFDRQGAWAVGAGAGWDQWRSWSTGLETDAGCGVPGTGGMEVGWRLASRAWHCGYATEAGCCFRGRAWPSTRAWPWRSSGQ